MTDKPPLVLIRHGAAYMAYTTRDGAALPKSAGFMWWPDKKAWWTKDPVKAATLRQFASGETREELELVAEAAA